MRSPRLSMMLACAAAALLALCSADASAQTTLYKLIDKNGKVTYSEKPPKDFDGKVIPLDINPDRNTATLPKPPAATKSEEGGNKREDRRFQRSTDGEERVRAAKEKVEAAKRALADAQNNPQEGDVTRVGNVGGGARPVFSEDYQRRLDKLERDVKDAEDELKRAEENR